MDSGTFKASIYELSLYFERKLPGDETVRLWADEVKSIPNIHAREIVSECKKLEAWPRNLPAVFWRLSGIIGEKNGDRNQCAIHPRRTNPAPYANKNCKTCNGTGLTRWISDKWPNGKDDQGNKLVKRVDKACLCPCTDEAEYGF